LDLAGIDIKHAVPQNFCNRQVRGSGHRDPLGRALVRVVWLTGERMLIILRRQQRSHRGALKRDGECAVMPDGLRNWLAGALLSLGMAAGFVDVARAEAACTDGATVTISGTVGDVFHNQQGTWTVPIFHGSGTCYEELGVPGVISPNAPPPACRRGASATATIQVSYDPIIGADQTRLIALNCR
jgi:hypothetical protein